MPQLTHATNTPLAIVNGWGWDDLARTRLEHLNIDWSYPQPEDFALWPMDRPLAIQPLKFDVYKPTDKYVVTVKERDEHLYCARALIGPVAGQDGSCIVVTWTQGYSSREEDAKRRNAALAKARLVAALPELLELATIFQWWRTGSRGLDTGPFITRRRLEHAASLADEALAKASRRLPCELCSVPPAHMNRDALTPAIPNDKDDGPDFRVLCMACSRAGGADMPIYHDPPVCSDEQTSGAKTSPDDERDQT